MAATTDFVFHSAVLLSLFKCCSAYCYGYCWYGSWYIWFAIIVSLAIGCGALGAYLRHRNVQRALHQTQTAVTVQVGGAPGTDAGPPGSMMMTSPQGGMMPPPPGGMMMPPPPGGMMMSPPDYNTVTGDNKMGTEASAHGAYTNQNFQMTEGAAPTLTSQQEKGGPLPMGQPQANYPYHTQPPYPNPLPPYSSPQPPYSTQAPYPTQQPAYPTQQPYPSQSPYPAQPPYSLTAPSMNKY